MTIDIDPDRVFLDPKTIARFAREWDKAKGEKNVRARKSPRDGDIIEISLDGSSNNAAVDEMLLLGGNIILENEMDQDLEEKK